MIIIFRIIYIQNAPEKPALPSDLSKLQSSKIEAPPQVYICPKTNSAILNVPSHSLLSTSDINSKDDGLKNNDIKFRTLQVLSTHCSLNVGCDKNDVLKTGEKEKVICKKEIDVSSDEGETYGLLNI